jgi:hypothetical protein
MIEAFTNNLVALINALGGFWLTTSVAVVSIVWVISNRAARGSAVATQSKHEEVVVAEANRHSERIALIKANDPKVIEGLNKQLSRD